MCKCQSHQKVLSFLEYAMTNLTISAAVLVLARERMSFEESAIFFVESWILHKIKHHCKKYINKVFLTFSACF